MLVYCTIPHERTNERTYTPHSIAMRATRTVMECVYNFFAVSSCTLRISAIFELFHRHTSGTKEQIVFARGHDRDLIFHTSFLHTYRMTSPSRSPPRKQGLGYKGPKSARGEITQVASSLPLPPYHRDLGLVFQVPEFFF